MGIVSKLFPRDDANQKARTTAATDWIDLSDYAADKTGDNSASTWIRFASLKQLDDLKTLSTHVYDGTILILDFAAVQGDEIVLRRLTNELRKIAQDTGGDLAGLGDHHILLTPRGVKVDRNKLSSKPQDTDDAPVMRTNYNQAPAAPAPTTMPAAASSAPATPQGRRTNGIRK